MDGICFQRKDVAEYLDQTYLTKTQMILSHRAKATERKIKKPKANG